MVLAMFMAKRSEMGFNIILAFFLSQTLTVGIGEETDTCDQAHLDVETTEIEEVSN